jgi:MFS family permease
MFGIGLAAWWPMMAYLSVFVRDNLGHGILSASLLFLAIHGVTSTLGLASGPWIRRFGSKSTYALGLFGLSVFMLVLGISSNFTLVIVMAPVMGFFLAFHWTGAQAYVIESSPEHQRGLGSGIATFTATLVPAMSAPILGIIADKAGFHTMAIVAFGIVLTGLVITVFALPNIRRPNEAISTKDSAPPEETELRRRGLLQMPGLIWMLVVRGSTSMMLGVFVLLAGPKLIDSGGLMSSIGFFVAGTSLGGGLAQIGIGWASDRIGRRSILLMTMVIGIVSSVAFGLTDNLFLLLAASGFHGLFRNATQTLLVAVTGDITPRSETGRVSSLLTSAFSIGMVIGVLVAGILFQSAPVAPFIIAGLIVAVAIFGIYRIPMNRSQAYS